VSLRQAASRKGDGTSCASSGRVAEEHYIACAVNQNSVKSKLWCISQGHNNCAKVRELAFSILALRIAACKTKRELTVLPKSRMILPHPYKLDNRSN